MTGVSFELSMQDSENWPPSYQNEMMLMALSFVCSQKECGIFSDEREEIIRLIEDKTFESYNFSYFGVEVNCDVEYSGYIDITASRWLWPKEGEKNRYEIRFEMKKVTGS